MSKKQKLLQKLQKLPRPKDFTWDELTVLLEQNGFETYPPPGGGSHYTFQHESGFTFGVSKTHPSGILKAYQIKNAIDALESVGVIGKAK
jgi:predicted RNA binding protein YcfA (HicA-like mRNA interferase family)